VYNPVSAIEVRDTMKQMQAQQQGITLVTIPFWWDRSPQRFFFLIFFSQLNIRNAKSFPSLLV
jgi:hypothetical protein